MHVYLNFKCIGSDLYRKLSASEYMFPIHFFPFIDKKAVVKNNNWQKNIYIE